MPKRRDRIERKPAAARDERPALSARTFAQSRLLKAIHTQSLVFATGVAGTGKTFLCAASAIDALQASRTGTVWLTRPNVEAGRPLGFLPGDLSQKFDPYLAPYYGVFAERTLSGFAECAVKSGRIKPVPLGFMRGLTFSNCWVILDEAQNTTPTEMKMFLTRIGEDCKVLVTGDPRQQDIPGRSGLDDAVSRLVGIPGFAHVEFGDADVVRSDMVGRILRAYGS